jgi:hypothetical protein
VLTLRRIQRPPPSISSSRRVFMLLDGEGFILQVQRVFTRIRSGATAVATGGSAPGSTISTKVAVCTSGGFLERFATNGCKCGG